MIFLWDHYFSVEGANLALEQNKEGELMEINGIRVYRSSNMEKNRFVWIEGKSVYSLTTTCDEKRLKQLSLHLGNSRLLQIKPESYKLRLDVNRAKL